MSGVHESPTVIDHNRYETQENPMASILITIAPVLLTFAVAAWRPASKHGIAASLEDCTHC
jgi:hypothetical protein